MALISRLAATRAVRPARRERPHRDEAVELLDQVGMAAMPDRPARALAYGDVKRVELAIALAGARSCC